MLLLCVVLTLALAPPRQQAERKLRLGLLVQHGSEAALLADDKGVEQRQLRVKVEEDAKHPCLLLLGVAQLSPGDEELSGESLPWQDAPSLDLAVPYAPIDAVHDQIVREAGLGRLIDPLDAADPLA